MRNYSSVEATVLGGLPVTVACKLAPAERDVGIMSEYIDEWYIEAINNRACKKPSNWLYNRIDKTKGEKDKLLEFCFDILTAQLEDYNEL